VLRSPAHRTLSGALVLLRRQGQDGGSGSDFPVLAASSEAGLVVLAVRPAGKRWWRAYVEPTPAVVTVRREQRQMVGAVLEGAARRTGLRAYVERFPRTRGALGLGSDPSDAELDAADAAVVLFRPIG
jgi:hypothetical protein